MKNYTREITEEIYNNAIENGRGYITKEDMDKVFDICEVWGYGVYCPSVAKENGKFVVHFSMGSTCD